MFAAVVVALGVLVAPTLAAASVRPATFASSVITSTGETLTSVAVGDFNRDGNRDVAFAATSFCGGCSAGAPPAVEVALGDGHGGLGPLSTTLLPAGFEAGDGYAQLALAAVRSRNGRRTDLAVGGGAGSVLVLRGNGRGGFTTGPTYSLGGPVTQLIARDLNGDGRLDLAAIVHDPVTNVGHVAVLFGQRYRAFSGPHILDAAESPSSLAIADINRDGRPDLIVATNTPTGTSTGVSVLLANGRGGFGTPRHHVVAEASMLLPWDVTAGDVTGDGRADVIVRGWLLRGRGDGTLGVPRAIPVDGPLALGDFNVDGRLDIAGSFTPPPSSTSGSPAPYVRILLSEGRRLFSAPLDLATIPTNCCTQDILQQTVVTDLNNDRKPDLISAGLVNTGSGFQFGFAVEQLNQTAFP